MYFAISLLSPLGKGHGPSFEQIWIPITQGCFVPSMVKIGQVVLEKKIFKFINAFSQFHNYLPLEKGVALHLNKLEFPSPNDALCQVWLKNVALFSRGRFLNFVNIFSLICNYLPFEKDMALQLDKIESPSPKDALCQV